MMVNDNGHVEIEIGLHQNSCGKYVHRLHELKIWPTHTGVSLRLT